MIGMVEDAGVYLPLFKDDFRIIKSERTTIVLV
jgi:hypothetical protein